MRWVFCAITRLLKDKLVFFFWHLGEPLRQRFLEYPKRDLIACVQMRVFVDPRFWLGRALDRLLGARGCRLAHLRVVLLVLRLRKRLLLVLRLRVRLLLVPRFRFRLRLRRRCGVHG